MFEIVMGIDDFLIQLVKYCNSTDVTATKSPSAFLLSIYDKYTIAYKDRSDISESRDIERMILMGNALTAVIILNGKVAGTWDKTLKKSTVEITLNPFWEFDKDEQEELESGGCSIWEVYGNSCSSC